MSGSQWGPFSSLGNAMGNGDMDFNMSMQGNGRGNGLGNMFGDGRGYHQPWGGMEAPIPAPPAQPESAPAETSPSAAESDSDSDSVADLGDMCANTPAGTSVDAFGCPKDAAIVLRGVNFKTNSDELTSESTEILDRVGATLAANPSIKVEVAGHTDADGDDAYNKDLSQRRAEMVVGYLTGKGVNLQNLSARGYGEEQPMASNDTAEGKAQNRRVELNRR